MNDCERRANWEYSKRVEKALRNRVDSAKAYELGEEVRKRVLKECLEENDDEEDHFSHHSSAVTSLERERVR